MSIGHKATAEEIKEKMEQELRAQRAEHHKKRTLEMMQQKKGMCSPNTLQESLIQTASFKKEMAHKFHCTKTENDEFICLNFQANALKDDLNNSSKTAQGIDGLFAFSALNY